MGAGQRIQRAALHVELTVRVMDVGLAGEKSGAHGAGVVSEALWAGRGVVLLAGDTLGGTLGRNSGPVWPHAPRVSTQISGIKPLTRIRVRFNIVKL